MIPVWPKSGHFPGGLDSGEQCTVLPCKVVIKLGIYIYFWSPEPCPLLFHDTLGHLNVKSQPIHTAGVYCSHTCAHTWHLRYIKLYHISETSEITSVSLDLDLCFNHSVNNCAQLVNGLRRKMFLTFVLHQDEQK